MRNRLARSGFFFASVLIFISSQAFAVTGYQQVGFGEIPDLPADVKTLLQGAGVDTAKYGGITKIKALGEPPTAYAVIGKWWKQYLVQRDLRRVTQFTDDIIFLAAWKDIIVQRIAGTSFIETVDRRTLKVITKFDVGIPGKKQGQWLYQGRDDFLILANTYANGNTGAGGAVCGAILGGILLGPIGAIAGGGGGGLATRDVHSAMTRFIIRPDGSITQNLL